MKTESIDTLLGGLEQEILGPLNVVRLQLDLLERHVDDRAQSTARIRLIQSELMRITGLFSDFSILLRAAPIEPVELSLNRVLPLVLDARRVDLDRLGVTVDLEVEAAADRVIWDRRMFEQALLLIVDNALDAMSERGRLFITASFDDGLVKVTVKDTGPGPSEEAKTRAFEPFFTTKVRGRGLGLTVARRLLEAQRGTIIMDWDEVGTLVHIVLPREVANSAPFAH